MCVCAHARACAHIPGSVYTPVCVCISVEAKGQYWKAFSTALHLIFWDRVSLHLELRTCLDLLASKLQESSHPPPTPQCWLQTHGCALLLHTVNTALCKPSLFPQQVYSVLRKIYFYEFFKLLGESGYVHVRAGAFGGHRCQVLLQLESQVAVNTWSQGWELNSSPLKEQCKPLTTEPVHQSYKMHSCTKC